MVDRIKPASWLQLVPLGWLMARAFSANRVLAVFAAPIAMVSLVPYITRRVLFRTNDGHGMVSVGRYRPVIDVVLSLPAAAVIAFGWLAIAVGLLQLGALGVLLIVVVLIGPPVLGLLSMSTSLFNSPVGSETPRGPRWMVANLAQRPGTELSALLLTYALVRSLPSGSILVAAAASDPLADRYVRLGFTRTRGRRVCKVV